MAYLTQYSSSIPVIKFNIDQTLMTIGQDIEMDICVPEEGVADNHATVEAIKHSEAYRFIVKSYTDEPLLELNGETVSHAELQDGDWLIIGGVEFQFTDDGVNKIAEKSKPIQIVKENKNPDTLKVIKDLKEEVKTMSTKEFIANSRRGRPRLVF